MTVCLFCFWFALVCFCVYCDYPVYYCLVLICSFVRVKISLLCEVRLSIDENSNLVFDALSPFRQNFDWQVFRSIHNGASTGFAPHGP